MAPKNLLGKLAGMWFDAVLHPIATTDKVVQQARGTAALGTTVTRHMGRTAFAKAATTASGLAGRSPHPREQARIPAEQARTPAERARIPAEQARTPDAADAGTVPASAAEGAGPDSKARNTGRRTAKLTTAPSGEADPSVKSAAPARKTAARRTTGTEAEDKEAAVRKTPARKATARKATARKATARKGAANATPARKATAMKGTETSADGAVPTPADVAPVIEARAAEAGVAGTVEAAASEDPGRVAATPAATPAQEQAAETVYTTQTLTAGGTEGTKSLAAGAADAADAAGAAGAADDVAPTADQPLIDPATAKAVASETDTMRRAAEQSPH